MQSLSPTSSISKTTYGVLLTEREMTLPSSYCSMKPTTTQTLLVHSGLMMIGNQFSCNEKRLLHLGQGSQWEQKREVVQLLHKSLKTEGVFFFYTFRI